MCETNSINELAAFSVLRHRAWCEYLTLNDHGTGYKLLCFASQWASAIETKMAEGVELEEVADALQAELDTKFLMSGFGFGFALRCLESVWVHGERLYSYYKNA